MAIREELELDITSALDTVDTVGAALDAVAASFAGSVATALTELDSVSNITADATITADTAGVEAEVASAIDAAASAANPVVSVGGDTSGLVSDIEAVGTDAVISVPVVADTSGLQEDLDGLSASGNQAAAGVGAAGAATTGLSVATGLAAGNTGALTGSLASSIPVIGGVVAGVTILAGSTDKFFDSAVNAQAATERFNQTFGTTADSVNNINVGNLDVQLKDLNLSLGSSTTQVRNALSSFGQLGQASGGSAEGIAQASEQIVVLSARAVALNPALGSVGDVAESMSKALTRGGRFASQYGIALTAAEINARALADTGKTNVSQLNQYEKAAAGAALATEKYGDTLKETIEKGTENPLIQLKSIQAELGKVTTELGKPLVAPVFDIIRAAQPILISFTKLIGDLALAVVPVALQLLQAVAPVVTLFAGELTKVVTILAPALGDLGQSVAEALSPIATTLGIILPIIEPFASGLAFVATGIANLLSALGPLPGLLTVAYIAFQLFTLAMQVNPLILIATAILGIIGVIRSFNTETKAATVNQEAFRSQLFGTASSAEELRAKLAELKSGAAEYLATQSEIAKAGQTGELLAIGQDAETVTRQLNTGAKGFNEFISAGIRAGEISIRVDGVGQSSDDINSMNESLSELLVNGRATVTQSEGLVVAVNHETFAREQASQAQLNQLVITGQITEAQRVEAVQRSTAELGIGSYTQALGFALEAQKASAEAVIAADPPLSQNAASWTALAQSVADGSLNMTNAQVAADATGVSLEVMQGFIRDTGATIDAFVANSVSKLPSVQTVFANLKTESDPTTLSANLDAATLSILTFSLNLDTIAAGGFTEVAKFLQEQGPEAAGSFAASFTSMTEEQKNALNTSIANNNNARKAYGDDLKNDIANSAEASKAFAENSTKGFAEGLDYSGVTDTEVKAAQEKLKGENLDLFKADAKASGVDIGAALAFGLAEGLGSNSYLIEQAARDAISKSEEAARIEAESNSPSKLFARVGEDLGAGVALGLSNASSQVVKEAEAIVRAAAQGANNQPFVVSPTLTPLTATSVPVTSPLAASGTLGATTIDVGGMTVKVTTNSPSQARAIGVSLAEGFVTGLDSEGRIG